MFKKLDLNLNSIMTWAPNRMTSVNSSKPIDKNVQRLQCTKCIKCIKCIRFRCLNYRNMNSHAEWFTEEKRNKKKSDFGTR